MFKKKVDVREEMMAYMNNKYDEEFTFVAINTQVWRDTVVEMLVRSAAFPNENIIVHRDKKSGEIRDGYLALKLNDGIEAEIADVVSTVLGENQTFNYWQDMPLPSSYTPDMSASDFLKAGAKRTSARIFISKNVAGKDNDAEVLRKALTSKGYYLTFYLVYVDENALDSVTRDYKEYFSKGRDDVHAIGFFVMDNSFKFSAYDWRQLE